MSKVVGYQYEFDLHCVVCATMELHNVLATKHGAHVIAISGKPVTAIFDTDGLPEWLCASCGAGQGKRIGTTEPNPELSVLTATRLGETG